MCNGSKTIFFVVKLLFKTHGRLCSFEVKGWIILDMCIAYIYQMALYIEMVLEIENKRKLWVDLVFESEAWHMYVFGWLRIFLNELNIIL